MNTNDKHGDIHYMAVDGEIWRSVDHYVHTNLLGRVSCHREAVRTAEHPVEQYEKLEGAAHEATVHAALLRAHRAKFRSAELAKVLLATEGDALTYEGNAICSSAALADTLTTVRSELYNQDVSTQIETHRWKLLVVSILTERVIQHLLQPVGETLTNHTIDELLAHFKIDRLDRNLEEQLPQCELDANMEVDVKQKLVADYECKTLKDYKLIHTLMSLGPSDRDFVDVVADYHACKINDAVIDRRYEIVLKHYTDFASKKTGRPTGEMYKGIMEDDKETRKDVRKKVKDAYYEDRKEVKDIWVKRGNDTAQTEVEKRVKAIRTALRDVAARAPEEIEASRLRFNTRFENLPERDNIPNPEVKTTVIEDTGCNSRLSPVHTHEIEIDGHHFPNVAHYVVFALIANFYNISEEAAMARTKWPPPGDFRPLSFFTPEYFQAISEETRAVLVERGVRHKYQLPHLQEELRRHESSSPLIARLKEELQTPAIQNEPTSEVAAKVSQEVESKVRDLAAFSTTMSSAHSSDGATRQISVAIIGFTIDKFFPDCIPAVDDATERVVDEAIVDTFKTTVGEILDTAGTVEPNSAPLVSRFASLCFHTISKRLAQFQTDVEWSRELTPDLPRQLSFEFIDSKLRTIWAKLHFDDTIRASAIEHLITRNPPTWTEEPGSNIHVKLYNRVSKIISSDDHLLTRFISLAA